MNKPSVATTSFPARWIAAFVAALAVALLLVSPKTSQQKTAPAIAQTAFAPWENPSRAVEQQELVRARLGALPLAFEANQGQTDPQVKYLTRANGYTLFLTAEGPVFSLRASASGSALGLGRRGRPLAEQFDIRPVTSEKNGVVRMQLVGGASRPRIASSGELASPVNYYIGNDPRHWQEGVGQFSKISYQNVYPGVNLAFHGQQRELEFDFVVAAHADAAPITLGFQGAQHISTGADGNLELTTAAGTLRLHPPFAYQQVNSKRQPVDARFVLKADNQVGFQLGSYDPGRELVIDPTMTYTTYLGGAAEDEVFAITTDSSGNVYVTGESSSTSGFPGGTVPSGHGLDAFVTKLTAPNYNAVGFTTFFGGSGNESGQAIAVNTNGIYVAGITTSTNLPKTAGSAQPNSGGGGGNCNNQKGSSACTDGFVFKLDSTGALVIASYIGGSNFDDAYALALDPSGNVWVGGDTSSSDFHLANALYSSFNNGSTVSPPWNDGFVAEFPAGLTSFMFSTLLPGHNGDQVNAMAIDPATGNVYVAGETNSPDFPVTAGVVQGTCGSDGKCNANAGNIYYDAFVTGIKADKSGLIYSTYLGGSSDDYAYALALDTNADVYITGETRNNNPATPPTQYPTTTGAFSTTYNAAASSNAFVTELNSNGTSLMYSTFLGGSTQDWGGGIAVDHLGNAYVTGFTASPDFPVTANAIQSAINGTGNSGNSDAFVTQILPGGASPLGYSSFFGGSKDENALASAAFGAIALDPSNNIWIAGSTVSKDLPVTSGAVESAYGGGSYDGFVAELAPTFSITATTPLAVNPGANAISTINVFSVLGYNQSVNLSCAVSGGGSPAPKCSASSFSKQSVTPTASGVSSTLTVTTSGPTGALYRPSGIVYAMASPLLALPIAGVWLGRSGHRRGKLACFLMMLPLLASLLVLPSCSSSTGGTSVTGCTGCTPAGNYTVTVTGTDSNNLSNSVQFTLHVN